MLDPIYSDELYHYGIEGMKWGVRRFQNPDGTLTKAGKKRYQRRDGSLNKTRMALDYTNDLNTYDVSKYETIANYTLNKYKREIAMAKDKIKKADKYKNLMDKYEKEYNTGQETVNALLKQIEEQGFVITKSEINRTVWNEDQRKNNTVNAISGAVAGVGRFSGGITYKGTNYKVTDPSLLTKNKADIATTNYIRNEHDIDIDKRR